MLNRIHATTLDPWSVIWERMEEMKEEEKSWCIVEKTVWKWTGIGGVGSGRLYLVHRWNRNGSHLFRP